MRGKPQAKKIGMIGKTWLSAGKIKAVLANLEACKQFLLKYDVQEAPAAPIVYLEAAKEKEALLAKMALLQAQVAQLSAQNNGHTNRIDPVQKAA